MSRCLDWIKGILYGGSLRKRVIMSSCSRGRSRYSRPGYYEELLEEIHQMEAEIENLAPSLNDKIQNLKLEVRYILPYVQSCRVTEDEHYEETKRRFGIECLQWSDGFVDYMMEQTLLVKPDATDFYLSTSMGRCKWSRFTFIFWGSHDDSYEFTDYVLDNLKYVQRIETSQTVTATKEQLKDIEEKLTYCRTCCVLVEKWTLDILDCTEVKVHDIYVNTVSVFGKVASLFQLFIMENIDESQADEMDLGLSDLLLRINDIQLQAKEVYFDILKLLRSSLPVMCKVPCGFIGLLQDNLEHVSRNLHLLMHSRSYEIPKILLEVEFLISILKDSCQELLEHGKLNAICTHIDLLARDAEFVLNSSVDVLVNQGNHGTRIKVSESFEAMKLTGHEIREIIKKDLALVHSSVDDFLKCLRLIENDRHLQCIDTQSIKLELKFLRTFLRYTARWHIDHPQLGVIRLHTENVVHKAWWEFCCILFGGCSNSNDVDAQNFEYLFSDLLRKVRMKKLDVEEVCTKIRVLNPSPATSPMSEVFGLNFADALVYNLKDLQACSPWTGSFALLKNQLDDKITFLGQLFEKTAKLCGEDESRTDLLTYLEDVTERAACLTYLRLVNRANRTMSITELLLLVKEPEIRDIFVKFIEAPAVMLLDSDMTVELLLNVVTFLKEYLMKILNSDASMAVCGERHIKTLQRELNVLRCILKDPLKQYSEQEELDDLLKDVRAGIFKAGLICCFLCINKLQENTHFIVGEAVEHFKATVEQAYSKFVKLSPSKLPKSELGFVDILLANHMELKEGKLKSAAAAMPQLSVLYDDLTICSSFLQEKAFKHDEREEVKHLRTRILNVGCKMENIINTFEDIPGWFFEMQINDVIEEVNLVKEELKQIIQKVMVTTIAKDLNENYQVQKDQIELGGHFEKEAKAPELQEEVVVGFENEEKELIRKLITGQKQLEIVSIVGMPGLGKTTLAMKVYKSVADSFHSHAWCYVSQNSNKRELLKHIWNQIDGPNSENKELEDKDLPQELYQSLYTKKNYLIVLDDVWEIKAWDALKPCFPLGENGSRILLTSRFKLIGEKVSPVSTRLELKLLSAEESWHLLEKKVFGSRSCPPHLCAVGEEIAKSSEGLPLSIVVIAGVLKNIEKTEHKWKQVENTLHSLLVENQDGVMNKLELSYNHLPVHMKQCFLYCGAFLRGREIPVSKVVRLCVAERFLEEKTDQQCSLEDATYKCLRELVNRSLLMVTRTGSDNRIRTCRMHDLLRDFCLWKADADKFLHIIDRWNGFRIWQWRMCFCSRQDEFLKFKNLLLSKPRTRSLMFFGAGDVWQYESIDKLYASCDISFICQNFKLLKVLDLECINLGHGFPESVTTLIPLTYLALHGQMNDIPSSIGKLLNLEILIVKGILGEVELPDTIFNLTKLRHLLVNNRAKVTSTKSSPSLDSLQSFSNPVFSWSTAEHIIRRLPNLRNLKCIFLATNVFPILKGLDHLESLKVLYSHRVQFSWKFSLPLNLKKLTLSKFHLPWSEIETVAALPQLEVLKLLVRAFEGQSWDTSTEFPKLKYLRLDNLDSIEDWEASDDHFPCLERLVIQRCKQLKSIPPAFGDLGNLKCIEVHYCSRSVAKSAKQIEYEQRNCLSNKQFKSITYPPELDSFDELSD